MEIKRKKLKKMIKDLLFESTFPSGLSPEDIENLLSTTGLSLEDIENLQPGIKDIVENLYVVEGRWEDLVIDKSGLERQSAIEDLLRGDISIENIEEETEVQIIIKDFLLKIYADDPSLDLSDAVLEYIFKLLKKLGVGPSVGVTLTGIAAAGSLPLLAIISLLVHWAIPLGNYSSYKSIVSNLINIIDLFTAGGMSRCADSIRKEYNVNRKEISKNFIMLYVETKGDPVKLSLKIDGKDIQIEIKKDSKQLAQQFFKDLIYNIFQNVKKIIPDFDDISDFTSTTYDMIMK